MTDRQIILDIPSKLGKLLANEGQHEQAEKVTRELEEIINELPEDFDYKHAKDEMFSWFVTAGYSTLATERINKFKEILIKGAK